MELKKYQQSVIDDLTRYLALLNKTNNLSTAYRLLWEEKKVAVGFGGLSPYQDILHGVPNVCLKVPTGGGKTFIASCSIKPLFDNLPLTKAKAVVWLVPSDAILEQTIKNLSNPHHPYRQRINTDFAHRVEVYTKQQLLCGQNFNPTIVNEQLSIFILSYDSFRTANKDGRKAYQENGNLALFAKFMNDPSLLLADMDETALMQVIRYLNPVVIVDESHHATTPLSKEMLANFKPSFILDLTATPKKDSNIISYVDAIQLKKENMVKLPVIVYNRKTNTDVFMDAITIRDKLEAQAERERTQSGLYIRPIVLFQAEPRGNGTTTFDKIKKWLLDAGIPANQIAIKTADKNELRGIDLLSEGCPIRYIITINALKEGWDCPFAYILATIANRTSVVDVEQILGRILRLPHTRKNESIFLNNSYVITASNDFHATLQQVVAGLNNAGFSEKDYRIGSIEDSVVTPSTWTQIPITALLENDADEIVVDIKAVKEHLDMQATAMSNIESDEIFVRARAQAEEYESIVRASDNSDFAVAPSEVKPFMKIFNVNDCFANEISNLRLPQFVIPHYLPMFEDVATALLTKENLTDGFTLRDKDTLIDFSTVEAEIARVDVDISGSTPKTWKVSGTDNYIYREWFESLSLEKRTDICKQVIVQQLSKINSISNKDLSEYVGRIMASMTPAHLEDLQQSHYIYVAKIKKKIDSLLDLHREKIFDLWTEQGKIICEPRFVLKKFISPLNVITSFPKMLYAAEEEMNDLERDVAWELANLENIKWWHRNIDRSGFNINGYVNAYPDIIAMTKSGKILMIEPKGDHLENSESRQKAKIGKAWEKLAGSNYRYYMVFREKDLKFDGAVRFDRFMEIIKGL